jgi:tRNA nucleotidyltransferase (CCA-adding enzyme)
LFGASSEAGIDAGKHLERALERSASHALSLPARYALLAYDFSAARKRANGRARVSRADAISARLKVPVDCRDAARLLARWRSDVERIDRLTPASIVELLQSANALRRPERLSTLLAASEAIACSIPRASATYAPVKTLRQALRVVAGVDAGAIARAEKATSKRRVHHDDAIAKAIRSARLDALRKWKQQRARAC